jgi:opacity protein-like surface antigen
MKLWTRALVALLLAGIAAPALADGAVNGMIGGRTMNDENYWGPLEHNGSFGVVADLSMGPALPVWWTASAVYSGNQKGDAPNEVSSDVGEVTAGLKLMPRNGLVRPYAGVGVLRNWSSISSQDNTVSDSDTSRGWYVDGGAQFRITRHVDLLLNLRWIKDTRIVLYGVEGDADGRMLTIGAGYTWGDSTPRHHEAREPR